MKRGYLQAKGIHLHYLDSEGKGPAVLLLHGLMGRATTWLETAKWLIPHFRVIALDQRGHGLSEKVENAYSRKHYVDDAIAVIEHLQLSPVIVIGHSLGALNAWVLAARRPDLVSAVIINDMTANTLGLPYRESWASWFDRWPLPFASMKEVRGYFYSLRPSYADYFMEIMEEREDGYWPLFEVEHMLQSIDGQKESNYWSELREVQCPALVVRGEMSDMPRAEMIEMANQLRYGQFVEIPGAGHVVHYDQPASWKEVVLSFLKERKFYS